MRGVGTVYLYRAKFKKIKKCCSNVEGVQMTTAAPRPECKSSRGVKVLLGLGHFLAFTSWSSGDPLSPRVRHAVVSNAGGRTQKGSVASALNLDCLWILRAPA